MLETDLKRKRQALFLFFSKIQNGGKSCFFLKYKMVEKDNCGTTEIHLKNHPGGKFPTIDLYK